MTNSDLTSQTRGKRPALSQQVTNRRQWTDVKAWQTQDISSKQKWSTKEVPPWNGQQNYFTGGLKPVSLNRFKPSSKIFYWPFQGGTSFVDLLCFCSVLCLLCLCARLFICALWSPAGKGLTSWLSVVVSTVSCHFPICILGQVWYLIVSIPDLCTLTYFHDANLTLSSDVDQDT